MNWIKAHWVIVASLAVMLIAPPAMIYFAQRMSSSLTADVQKAVDADTKAIGPTGSDRKVTYSIPSPIVGGPPTEFTGAPNQNYIEFFKDKRLKQVEALSRITTVAIAFNKGQRRPLVEGVFPDSETAKIKRVEFQTAYVKTAIPALFKRLKIGPNIPPAELAAQLSQKKIEVLARLTGQGADKLTADSAIPEEVSKVYFEEMKKNRINLTRQHAASQSMYVVEPELAFSLPPENAEPPDMVTLYDQQWQHWIREDIINAAVLASSGAESEGIPGAVVKRIERLRVGGMPAGASAEGGPAIADPRAAVPMDKTASLSGRISGPGTGNGYYDIRIAWVTVVISQRTLPRFVDALAATNFMTVLDMDLDEINVFDDLKVGFYYGDEPVVRATFQIETVWLREWLKPYMPRQIRQEFGVPEDPVPDPAAPAEGEPAAPPAG